MARAHARNAEREAAAAVDETRIDNEAAEFHDRVHQAYASLCTNEPMRIRRIDAGGTVEQVHAAIWSAVERQLAVHKMSRGPADV